MKLVWCPETASKAYLDAVEALAAAGLESADLAELVAALAGGWRASLIVDASWPPGGGDGPATAVALAAAARHTDARHVRLLPDGASPAGLTGEVVAGEAEEVMRDLAAVDFLVVDCRRRDAARVLREARAGPGGMVVVCKAAEEARRRGGAAAMILGRGMRVVRSAYLPIGRGVEILHVGVGKGPSLGAPPCGRWIKHVDRVTGEEHVFRR